MTFDNETRALMSRIYNAEKLIRRHYNGSDTFGETALEELLHEYGLLKVEFKERTGREWKSKLEKEGIL